MFIIIYLFNFWVDWRTVYVKKKLHIVFGSSSVKMLNYLERRHWEGKVNFSRFPQVMSLEIRESRWIYVLCLCEAKETIQVWKCEVREASVRVHSQK